MNEKIPKGFEPRAPLRRGLGAQHTEPSFEKKKHVFKKGEVVLFDPPKNLPSFPNFREQMDGLLPPTHRWRIKEVNNESGFAKIAPFDTLEDKASREKDPKMISLSLEQKLREDLREQGLEISLDNIFPLKSDE